jgi:hypothetical protein
MSPGVVKIVKCRRLGMLLEWRIQVTRTEFWWGNRIKTGNLKDDEGDVRII